MKNLFTTPFLLFVFLLLFPFVMDAQNGKIRGKVTEAATGEVLMFANVLIKDSAPPIGGQTDLDGNFEISIEPGTYALLVTYVGLSDAVVTGIQVKADEITIIDLSMKEADLDLDEVIVKADRIERNEVALLAMQRKSINVQDGISAQEISRYGSSNAAESMKRVTGASVVDGQYIYVRGLGDRYSSAQLNGLLLPSTDPYRNSTQLDIIPANLLDNLVATKTFTPNQPGNTTGGNVDIKTKSFPERMTLAANVSMSFNTLSSFNDNFLTYEGGENDGLGYDDGTRDIPAGLKDPEILDLLIVSNTHRDIARAIQDNEGLANRFNSAANSLNTNYQSTNDRSFTNHGISLSFGNQYRLFNNPLGILIGANYKKSYTFYDDSALEFYELSTSSDNLSEVFRLKESRSAVSPTLGGLANIAYKFGGSNKISFNTLYNHTATKSVVIDEGSYPVKVSGNSVFQSRNLRFRERELQSYQLMGEHLISKGGIKFEWAGGYVNTTQDEPDYRIFENTYSISDSESKDTSFLIDEAEITVPSHLWFDLEDKQYSSKFDLTIPFWQSKSKANKFQFGFLHTDKNREFNTQFFEFSLESSDAARYNGNPNQFLTEETVGVIGFDDLRKRPVVGYFPENQSVSTLKNSYVSNEKITAAYGMTTIDLNKWKFIVGARVEKTDLFVESLDTLTFDPGSIDQIDILPSLNAIYKLNENMNLRASATQTLARPNMRELAPFSSFDSNAGLRYTGNPNLKSTLIQNYDIRWEWFPTAGELFAISGYYKNFNDPIVMANDVNNAGTEIYFDNIDQATVYGIEFEVRKKLDFMSDVLSNFRIIANLSLIKSIVDIPAAEVELIERFNPDKGTTRPFQGQSPYLLNAGINYIDTEKGIDAILSFNMFGKRLTVNRKGQNPDFYQQPIPQLDFSFNKRISNQFSAKFTATNLLDAAYKESAAHKGNEYLVQQYDRGITFGLSLSYSFTPTE